MKTRIQNKHDTEANWNKAINFVPLDGELIIYDIDDNNSEPRMKIGDGQTTVTALPFCLTAITSEEINEICNEIFI